MTKKPPTKKKRSTARPPSRQTPVVKKVVKNKAGKTRAATAGKTRSSRKSAKKVAKAKAPPAIVAPAKTRVVIAQKQNADKFTLLGLALDQSRFWNELDRARLTAAKDPQSFHIIIKADLGLLDEGASTGTDPRLVEHLVDLLFERGYTSVVVGEGLNNFDLWLENRSVLVLAEMVGYKFRTEHGHDYEILDLSEDTIEVEFPTGSALYGTSLARAWVEANFRICFSKNKTDEESFYALGLHNLLDVLPLRDKDYHYHQRHKAGDVCVELLKEIPVEFSIIDAFVSNHGSAGSRVARPIKTETIIASTDLLLADWAGAIKMGLDPYASPVNSKALRAIGLPAAYEIVGDQSPYHDWINVHPLMADSVRRRNEWAGLSSAVKPWLQAVNQELFPFKDLANERVNSVASKFFSQPDDNPLAFWTLVGLNYWFGAVHQSLEALRTLYRKDSLRWIEAPLNVELSEYTLAQYEAIPDHLEPLQALVHNVAPDRDGLRWQYLDGSVLFEFSRTIPARFEEFVARVDITSAIEFMNDYIGGVAIPVSRDESGRVTHQAERNLYLTQPNYLVLYDGKVIDVTKLEYIRYAENGQKIFWKTIKSENDSATFDDGSVTFARTPENETLVTVFGRQQFTLPLFWQVFSLDFNPLLKDALVAHAYNTFLTQTLANFEAKFEGRAIRIGRPWNPLENEPGTESGKPPTERLSEAVEKLNAAGESVKKYWQDLRSKVSAKPQSKAANVIEIDQDGFSHFRVDTTSAGEQSKGSTDQVTDVQTAIRKASTEARRLVKDVGNALRKDMGVYREDK